MCGSLGWIKHRLFEQGAAGMRGRGAAGQGHGHFQFVAEQAQHMGDTGGAGGGQPVDGGAAQQHGRCAQCQGLEHIGAAVDAAIDQQR